MVAISPQITPDSAASQSINNRAPVIRGHDLITSEIDLDAGAGSPETEIALFHHLHVKDYFGEGYLLVDYWAFKR